jgi:hypothetical protein
MIRALASLMGSTRALGICAGLVVLTEPVVGAQRAMRLPSRLRLVANALGCCHCRGYCRLSLNVNQ